MTNTNTVISSSPNQCQVMLDNYASIVEKTNNQLGLWSNPYGLMIGILTLLMAIGAIFITYLLWKNSKDQKEMTKQFFIKQKALIEEKNKTIEKIQLKFENLIDEYKEKLKMTDGENKKQIQKAIDELKKEKLSAEAYINPTLATAIKPHNIYANYSPFNTAEKQRATICSECNNPFSQPITASMEATTVCPFCGAPNEL